MHRWKLPMVWWVLGGCAAELPSPPATPHLTITGSDIQAAKLLPALTDRHEQEVSSIQFTLSGGGSSIGFRDLLDDNADMAASTRRPMPVEEEQANVNGYSLDTVDSRHLVAVSVVSLSVHPDNPLQSITYDQVIGIFCTHEITDWAELGLDSAPIRAMNRDPRSGTRALFEDFFCGPKGIHPKIEVTDPAGIHHALQHDSAAVAYDTMANSSGRILGLKPDDTGSPVFPSQTNIIRGAYPLYHDLYLYTAGSPDPAEQLFLDWIESPSGQEVVDEANFVPLFLRPDRADEARPLRETIHFETGSIEPNHRSMTRLGLLVDELNERTGEYDHIVLEGFTDNREPDADDLSQQRAEVVRDLLSVDLPHLYFEIIPRGSRTPIAPNETPYGRERNRRVQVYLAAEERESNVETGNEVSGED